MGAVSDWKEFNRAWREQPPEKGVARRALRSLAIASWPIRHPHRTVKELESWGILLAVVALVLSLVSFWIDSQDRVEERTVRAWQLLTTPASGNSGKREALEYLNREDGICFLGRCWWKFKERTPLVGIDLSTDNENGSVWLASTDLSDAILTDANLSGANLQGAILTGADLSGADLRGADISWATLDGVILFESDLRRSNLSFSKIRATNFHHAKLAGANLVRADLEGSTFLHADLTGAKFRDHNLKLVFAGLFAATGDDPERAFMVDARNLTQDQLDDACGDESTLANLPIGLKLQLCSEVDWYKAVHSDR